MHILNEQRELKDHQPTLSASIACRLLKSLASLFASRFLYFQSFAASFHKTRGVWGTVFLCDTSAHAAALYTDLRRERYPLPSLWLVYLPLESTLAKVCQNKGLYLPLE
jgi:hypothetical protein